jgi:hypothetical protein
MCRVDLIQDRLQHLSFTLKGGFFNNQKLLMKENPISGLIPATGKLYLILERIMKIAC